jgi:hypothetical protein
MKILAFSDVYRWEGYEDLVDKHKPEIVVLAGDLPPVFGPVIS